MRHSTSLFPRLLLAGAVIAGLEPRFVQAQTGSGFSDFFVLGHEEHVWNMMNRVRVGEGAGAFIAGANRMNSIVSATSTAANQLVYYDHWEDGLETVDFTTTPPVQATTLILGDLNNANGRVCDWSIDPRVFPCNGLASHDDALYAGTPMSFASDQGMNAGGAAPALNCNVPAASPAVTQLRCSVPVPRAVPALATPTIRFDGGDRVFSSGGSISIAHIADPGTPLIGGGTELISRSLMQDAVAYSIPIGENLFPGANNAFVSVKYASLDIVAFDDNTSVSVNSPGFGTVSFVLHRGQHYSTCATFAAGSPGVCTAGAIDGPLGPLPDNRGVFPSLALTVNSATKVSTTGPLNALIFTGGTGSYQTRHYATLPDILHATDYVITAPGDDTAVQGTRALNLYLYNPNPTAAISVTARDSVGTTVIAVPANSVVDYRNATGRFVPNDSGVRLTSTRPFWGLSAYGISDNISDWGHAWLGVRFLATEYTLAYSPGSQPPGSGTNTVWNANLTTLTRNGAGLAIGTSASPHGFTTGERVLVTGVTNVTAFNGNFPLTVTGATTFTYPLAGAAIAATGPSLKAVTNGCDPVATATVPCNSFNRDPAWVAGTQNNTQVQVDFNNDNLWDFIDTDSDSCPNDGDVTVAAGICETAPVIAGCPVLTANRCIYLVNSPGSAGRDVLRVFDYTDFDNAGTHVLATRPVAMSWGQDVDQGQGSDPSPDNGYTIYPEIAIELVLGIQKTVAPARVPLGGTAAQRTATYTLRIFSGDYGPLNALNPTDTLPLGINCADYVAGSTLITYPDLAQTTVDPVCTDNVAPARDVLTWTLIPPRDVLLINQELTIVYRIVIPVNATARTLVNNAQVTGFLGSTIFRPRDSATLNQSDLSIVKSVADDGTPEIGDLLTYTVVVTSGGVAESNVVVTDAIPSFTTFVSGSITTTNAINSPILAGGLTRAAAVATARTTTPHGWVTGTSVVLQGATSDPLLWNGTFTVTVPAAQANTAIAWAGGFVTVTSAGHGLLVNDWVRIAGVTPAGYNGVFQVVAPVTVNTIRYALVANPGVQTALGTEQPLNRFSYTMTGTPGTSPATGTITARGATFDVGQNAIVWSGSTFAANTTATMIFQVRITESTPTGSIITNTANYASTSIATMDSNTVNTTVVGPTLQISKSGSPNPLHPNQVAAFELLIENVGTGPARTLVVTDALASSNTTYVPGTMSWSLNSGPFIPLTDANDADEARATGTTLTFGFARAVTSITRIGATATVTTSLAHGWVAGQTVTITGATDPLYNGNFVIAAPVTATQFNYTMAATPAANAGGTLTAAVTTLSQGSNIRFRFQSRVNLNTGGLFAANQAQSAATGQPTTDSNLVQIPIVGNATVTGHLFLDSNNNGVQNAGEPDLANVTVTITDSTSGVQTLVTDALGNYSVVVPAGSTTLTVNGLDPDIPPGSNLSTPNPACVSPFNSPPCNGTQSVVAVANSTVASTAVGYAPPAVSIAKTSNASGNVVPGQTVTYNVTISNFTGTTQTGVTLHDVIPTGTTFVANSASVTHSTTNPAFRVTEYYLDNVAPDQCVGGLEVGTDFAAGNLTCTMVLTQTLANNYFVMIQGSDNNGGDSTPASDYVSLTGAPAGTPGVGVDLAVSGAADRIVLTRQGSANAWIGVVTVVECIAGCAVNGFTLLDVQRVAHAGATAAGTDASAVAWTDLSRVVLMGGVSGAGCDTADLDVTDHESCHTRLFPTGTNTINWTRDATDAGMSLGTSTVMVLQWGTGWSVQRANPAGNNGGPDIDAAGEYNTAPISSVARSRTWVWGTGHTNNGNAGPSAEGVAITLGSGVAPGNASESTVAAGNYTAGLAINFDVYTLSHPSLAVDYDFIANGNGGGGGAQTVGQATNSATANRMAIVTNGLNDAGNNFPRPILSARYTTNTNIQLERRRSNATFAAWVQGINFNGVPERLTVTCGATYPPTAGNCTNPDVTGTNPNVATTASAFSIPSLQTLVFTYRVVVNSPLAGGITQIVNTATTTTTQNPTPRSASATDNVVRPGVKVEPNNAGFAAVPANAAGTSILFTQGVTNKGTTVDSFTLTLDSELANWKLELIDPATGTVIATDTNGDGIWDGGVTVSTGSLAVNATKFYTVRATVPFPTGAGTQNTVEFTATSALSPIVKDIGTDEITVLPASTFGPVVLLPDHSGIVTAGQTIAYTHRIFNNTGASETFDLTVDRTLGWPTTIHADTNGDGVYTPGTDLQVANTAALPNGGSQILFVVTTAPIGTPAGTDEVVHLTARSRSNPVQADAVTDTTTILAATTHDLAGGGTRMAAVGETTTFPGTLYNLTGTLDRYDFSITPSSLFGVDGFAHPSVLRVDTNADGVPDLTIAADTDGDGVWDQLCGAPLGCSAATYNNNGNGQPDIPVPASGALAYELVRAIDPAQAIWKEYATITATSFSTSERDSVTAQWIIAALSRASIRGLRVDQGGLIEFVTGTQQNTAFFNLYETAERSLDGPRTLLNATPVVSPAPDSLLPILYRVETSAIKGPYLLIEEVETTGNVFIYGPYSVANTRLRRGLERIEAQMDHFGVPPGAMRVSRQSMALVPGGGDPTVKERRRLALSRFKRAGPAVSAPRGILIEVTGEGEAAVPLSVLEAQGLPSPAPAEEALRLWRDGETVPLAIGTREGVSSLVFTARPLSTDYTDQAAYVLTWQGTGNPAPPSVPLTRSADPNPPGFARIERNSIYAASVPNQSDPWQWDLMSPSFGPTWPYPWWDPALGDFNLPNLVGGVGDVAVRIRVVGMSDHHHVVSAKINGQLVGTVEFEGRVPALIHGSISRASLGATGNKLTLVHLAQNPSGTSAPSGYAYIDYLDLAAPMAPGPSTAVVTEVRPFLPTIPTPAGIRYLILTHSAFRPEADRLAALKRAERIRAAVVDVEAAYDLFSGGVQEPQAIAAMIRHAATLSPGLQYVVLFGDDSLDPRNYLGGGGTSFVPSIMGNDGSSRIPNENAYADLDGDGAPELAIGRLPVTTLNEATAVVDKIENQSATLAASGNVHVFVSDDSRERDLHFGNSAREMSEKLPATATSILADVGGGIGTARSAMFGAWQTGTTITHYFGHGGPEIWTDEALFSADDVPDLPAAMSPMILLAWACQSQYYQNYYGPSVNEALFLAPGTGALASLGPVGISSPAHQRKIYERVYARLYAEGLSLGEIIRQAKVEALAEDPQNRDAVDGFMFFGDPSLKLPQPRPLGRRPVPRP